MSHFTQLNHLHPCENYNELLANTKHTITKAFSKYHFDKTAQEFVFILEVSFFGYITPQDKQTNLIFPNTYSSNKNPHKKRKANTAQHVAKTGFFYRSLAWITTLPNNGQIKL